MSLLSNDIDNGSGTLDEEFFVWNLMFQIWEVLQFF